MAHKFGRARRTKIAPLLDPSSLLDVTEGNTPSTMNSNRSHQNAGLSDGSTPPPKRRKVRKGTKSCWECNRRKIRCIFDEAGPAASCQECRQRGATCVSQENPEECHAHDTKAADAGERLLRVERLAERILEKLDAPNTSKAKEDNAPGPGDAPQDFPFSDRQENPPVSQLAIAVRVVGPAQPGPGASPITAHSTVAGHSTSQKLSSVRDKLTSALPSREDSYKIYQHGHSGVCLHRILFVPHSALESQFNETAEDSTESLYQSTHPAVLAKNMLIMAIMLQRADRDPVLSNRLSEPPQVIMKRLVDSAVSFVCMNDELMDSIEALLCLLLQSVYLANGGNMRLALLSCRRAMTIAQLMGLHRQQREQTIESFEPSHPIDSRVVWNRLLYIEHFICLLLGLPSSYRYTSAAVPTVIDDHPLERLEHLQVALAAKIMDRNERDPHFRDFEFTRSIDLDLQHAASTKPSRWWTVPKFANVADNTLDILWETLRMTDQLFHHFLIIQLHLPFMLQARGGLATDSSKLACINASREVLTRYIATRTYKGACGIPVSVDFLALVAAMSLLLGHIDTHRLNSVGGVLAHQRHTDRTMVEDTLECMHDACSTSKDVLSVQSADVLRKLLKIEENAARGLIYSTEPSPAPSTSDHRQWPAGEPSSFHLTVPYFGTVIISPNAPLRGTLEISTACNTSNQQQQSSYTHHTQYSDNTGAGVGPLSVIEDQGGESRLADPCLEQKGGSMSNHAEQWQAMHPGYTARVEDWSFQGVDAAFFDSITRGFEGFEPTEDVFNLDI